MTNGDFDVGMKGGFGAGLGGMWTGSWIPGRRRWPNREARPVNSAEEYPATPKQPEIRSRPRSERPPDVEL